MKKFLIVSCILIFIILIVFSIKNYLEKQTKSQNDQRYEEIKKDVEKEVMRYVGIVSPICEGNDGEMLITHKTLVYNGGFEQEKLLDVDGKSYCSVYALSGCDENDNHTYEIYIKCKDYQDKGFIQWHKPFENKQY